MPIVLQILDYGTRHVFWRAHMPLCVSVPKHNLGLLRLLIGVVNACEALDLALPCQLVQALGVALLTHAQWDLHQLQLSQQSSPEVPHPCKHLHLAAPIACPGCFESKLFDSHKHLKFDTFETVVMGCVHSRRCLTCI